MAELPADGADALRRADAWAAADETYLEICLSATPAQRLAWLEEAILLAAAAGVLPRLPDQALAYAPEEIAAIEREWRNRRGPRQD